MTREFLESSVSACLGSLVFPRQCCVCILSAAEVRTLGWQVLALVFTHPRILLHASCKVSSHPGCSSSFTGVNGRCGYSGEPLRLRSALSGQTLSHVQTFRRWGWSGVGVQVVAWQPQHGCLPSCLRGRELENLDPFLFDSQAGWKKADSELW